MSKKRWKLILKCVLLSCSLQIQWRDSPAFPVGALQSLPSSLRLLRRIGLLTVDIAVGSSVLMLGFWVYQEVFNQLQKSLPMVCRDILTHLIGAILNGVALPCLVSPYESCGGCGTEQGSAEGAAVCRDLVCQAVNQPYCVACTWFAVTQPWQIWQLG